MKTELKIKPDDFILSVLSPEDRLEAAISIAKETFKKTNLTINDIEKTVKRIRRRACENKKKQSGS
ncbi:MAG: hypothetical protein AB1546_06735 [bacterium]